MYTYNYCFTTLWNILQCFEWFPFQRIHVFIPNSLTSYLKLNISSFKKDLQFITNHLIRLYRETFGKFVVKTRELLVRLVALTVVYDPYDSTGVTWIVQAFATLGSCGGYILRCFRAN